MCQPQVLIKTWCHRKFVNNLLQIHDSVNNFFVSDRYCFVSDMYSQFILKNTFSFPILIEGNFPLQRIKFLICISTPFPVISTSYNNKHNVKLLLLPIFIVPNKNIVFATNFLIFNL
jgi:hypothetical protein